jgi:hypothetical protein
VREREKGRRTGGAKTTARLATVVPPSKNFSQREKRERGGPAAFGDRVAGQAAATAHDDAGDGTGRRRRRNHDSETKIEVISNRLGGRGLVVLLLRREKRERERESSEGLC